jgi:hypothetical protein
MNPHSQEICKKALETGNIEPENWIFKGRQFFEFLDILKDMDEITWMYELLPWLVPSTTFLGALGNEGFQVLRTSINVQWSCSLPPLRLFKTIRLPRPQPAYAVGFQVEAFTLEQLKSIGITTERPVPRSPFTATEDMIFPFLMAEAGFDNASHQKSLDSAAMAVGGIIELFSLVNRQKDLNGEILAFTVSYNPDFTSIMGYYPVLDGNTWKIHAHELDHVCLITSDEDSQYKTYRSIMQVYKVWMPTHLNRLRSVLDEYSVNLNFDGSIVSNTSRTAAQTSD